MKTHHFVELDQEELKNLNGGFLVMIIFAFLVGFGLGIIIVAGSKYLIDMYT